jgi:xanthine dehydrogenase YagS FAD-binding subunit
MNSFTYTRADAVETAVRETAADHAAKFIAGGTNLLDLMKENVERPDHLVDITRLPLRQIETLPDGGLRLGPMRTPPTTPRWRSATHCCRKPS